MLVLEGIEEAEALAEPVLSCAALVFCRVWEV